MQLRMQNIACNMYVIIINNWSCKLCQTTNYHMVQFDSTSGSCISILR